MANNQATPFIVAGVVVVGSLAGWRLWRTRRTLAGDQLTLEILTPPAGTSSPSGTRVDFSARALVGARDISELTRWFITKPTGFAGFWSEGATTFIIPTFLTTNILEFEARISDPLTGQSAGARRSVTIVVAQFPARQGPSSLGPGRGPAVSRVLPSFRRSDTGWQVQGHHVLEQPWAFARRS